MNWDFLVRTVFVCTVALVLLVVGGTIANRRSARRQPNNLASDDSGYVPLVEILDGPANEFQPLEQSEG